MTFEPPKPRAELLWLAVDFDGTLCESTWSVDNPTAIPGNPIAKNVVKLNRAVADGFKIWIHTSRPSSDYELVEAWLNHWGIHFDGIVTGKLLAYKYIDDRAVNAFDEEWV